MNRVKTGASRARKPVTLFARGARFMAMPGVLAVMSGASALAAATGLSPPPAPAGLGHAVCRPKDLAPAPGGARADLRS